MRVDFSISVNNQVSSGTDWYARGIGLVKEINSDNETWELANYGALPSPPPKLLSVTPAIGAADGGNLITLKGDGFGPGTKVSIDGNLVFNIFVEHASTSKFAWHIGVDRKRNDCLGRGFGSTVQSCEQYMEADKHGRCT
jgi:hypothetical protein